MSINLECDQFSLYQTPTDVTHQCYFKNGTMDVDTWQNIRDKYIRWLIETNKHDADHHAMAKEHADDLMSYPHLTFSIG